MGKKKVNKSKIACICMCVFCWELNPVPLICSYLFIYFLRESRQVAKLSTVDPHLALRHMPPCLASVCVLQAELTGCARITAVLQMDIP